MPMTHRLPALFAALLIVLTAPSLHAQNASPSLAAQIDRLIDAPRFAGADWGIAVVSLDSGRTLYAHHADQLMQPASTAKLFTAALVLDTLGADYRIPTRVLGGEIRRGALDGPLVLYGMGDPTLGVDAATLDWADQLATQLAANGLHHVRGDLIADATYFAGPPTGTGWEASDLQSWFAVPATALGVQENQVVVTVTPGTIGQRASLRVIPDGALPVVINELATAAPHAKDDINLYRAPGSDTLYAFGQVAVQTPPHDFKLAMPDPVRVAGEQLREALEKHGIRIDGKLVTLQWPRHDPALDKQPQTLAEVLSPGIGEIVQRGLKRSQNLYLQNLLLIAGTRARDAATQAGDTGFITAERAGIRALQQWLDTLGIGETDIAIEDGAGLSRGDLATPSSLARLLAWMATRPYAATLQAALPVAGVDGTLQWRMRNTPAENNVHAKTGSMNHVHCLAGYVTSASGEHLAFSVMLNNYAPPASAEPASREVDAVAQLLAGAVTSSTTPANHVITQPAN